MFALGSRYLLGTVAAAACASRMVSAVVPPSTRNQGSFVKKLDFKHRLRVCNAYPFAAAVEVYRDEHERLTGEAGPMSYKSCRDFAAPLKAGDRLEVKVGDVTAGTFAVSELPASDAVLLLVVQRHDTLSTAVSFESHIFASAEGPQVAILDAYRGTARAKPLLKDYGPHPRSEELRYDSVVAVDQGKYEVQLKDKDGMPLKSSELVALNHESYVLLRTGIEAKNGPSYPEELVVFPQSDAKSLHTSVKGGSSAVAPQRAVLAAAAGAAAALCL